MERRDHSTTLEDIARRANYSIATVSRALHNPGSPLVSQKTRAIIQQLAEEMGYVPNLSARSLANHRTGAYAIWLADSTDSYYWSFASALSTIGRRSELHLDFRTLSYVPQHPQEALGYLIGGVDGLIAIDVMDDFAHMMDPLVRTGLPFVLVDANPHDGMDRVFLDIGVGARRMFDCLWENNLTKIAYVVNETTLLYNSPKTAAYRDFCEAMGLQLVWVVSEFQERASAKTAIRDWLAKGNRPDALVCHTPAMAKGCMDALVEAGIDPFRDTPVGCIESQQNLYDTDLFAFTVVTPIQQLAQTAWQMLESRVQNSSLSLRTEALATSFVASSVLNTDPVPEVILEATQ